METLIDERQYIKLEQPPVVVLEKLNIQRRINKFLEETNGRLPEGGILVGNAETGKAVRRRILKKFAVPFNFIVYYMYLVIHRFFPKINKLSAKIYSFFNGHKYRILSKAEILGRVCSCGFSIVEYEEKDGLLNFVARKTGKPNFNRRSSYWPIFTMERVGKFGKPIRVYKLRTMHPYSEYLQQLLMQRNGLDKGGKFKEDFRVTSWGKIARKYWIDELPMVINLFKGDLKLIGVRPLSFHYYNLYSKELQMLRLMTKPGLIPPFYADMPETLAEIMDSEKKYLQEYYKKPLATDIKYFCKSIYNIVVKKARSK